MYPALKRWAIFTGADAMGFRVLVIPGLTT
jgi:hypothetical protein